VKYKKCHQGADMKARAAALSKPTFQPVRPGKLGPTREVPAHIPRTDYAYTGRPGLGVLGDPATRIVRMRKACKAAAEVLQEVGAAVRPGITTDELDGICHAAYIARGGYPSTLNYRGFKKSMCTSVNEVVVHGIPDDRALLDGDIVNCDVTIYLDGMHGDCSATFFVGDVDAESQRLVRVTKECLELGIAAVKPGRQVREIGRAIEAHATKHGFSVVRAYCGHGVGEIFHTPLQIAHYDDPDATERIEEGMIFTIEPMLNAGTWRTRDWDDNWTSVTADGKRSAQFEHTILVTADGAEILTLP
jgi:methionyl aminopeptidase